MLDGKDVIALVTCCRMSPGLTQDETLMAEPGKPQERKERNGMTGLTQRATCASPVKALAGVDGQVITVEMRCRECMA